MSRTRTLRWQNRIIAALLLCVCVALLWLNHSWHRQIDITDTDRHSLTPTSIDSLLLLPGPLDVTAIAPPDDNIRSAIETLVGKYRRYKPDIRLSWINPEVELARVRELEASAGGELILRYHQRERRLQQLSERSFTEALQQLSREGDRVVAFVTGHQERAPDSPADSGYSQIANTLKRTGMQIQPLSLVSVPRIPDNVDTLVIAAPRTDFFVGEVASVLDFLGRGGNLLWLIDDNEIAGLEALSTELGVDLMPGTVIDAGSQAWGADSPTFAIVDQFSQHRVNENLQTPVLLPQASSLAVTPLAGQTTLPLLQTGPESWNETGELSGAVSQNPADGEIPGPLVLAAAIERQRQHKNQRIVIFGDADLFSNAWIGNGGNREYSQRLFNWLATDDSLVGFSTPAPADRLANLTSRQVLYYGGGFLVGLPLLFLLIALYTWWLQRKPGTELPT